MAGRVLVFPDSISKVSCSVQRLKDKKIFVNGRESSSGHRGVCTSGVRKNLPQTSNRFLKLITRKEVSELLKTQKESKKCLVIDPPELKESSFHTKVSPTLSKFLSKIYKLYPNCQIIPDNSYPEHGQYSYVFDKYCRRIDKFSELKEKPKYLYISSRFNLPDLLIHSPDSKQKAEISPNNSMNYINLYSSIIRSPDKNSTKTLKKPANNTLSRLKTINYNRKCTTPEFKSNDQLFTDNKHIFPCSTGKKIKEGPGGFRKINLLFDKKKYYNVQSLKIDRSFDIGSRASFTPTRMSQKDIFESDGMCVKYSLTKPEFLNILGQFNYLKEQYKHLWIENVAESFNVSPKVVMAVNGENVSELDLEEFLRFYQIVVLKRAAFYDLVSFIKNLWEIEDNCEDLLLKSTVASKSQNFYEKATSTISLLKESGIFQEHSTSSISDLIISLQDSEISIYDLRLIVMLLIKYL